MKGKKLRFQKCSCYSAALILVVPTSGTAKLISSLQCIRLKSIDYRLYIDMFTEQIQ